MFVSVFISTLTLLCAAQNSSNPGHLRKLSFLTVYNDMYFYHWFIESTERVLLCLLQWIKSCSHQASYTRCLLEKHGGRITVEQLICWLDKIGNIAARDALRKEYDSTNVPFTFDL